MNSNNEESVNDKYLRSRAEDKMRERESLDTGNLEAMPLDEMKLVMHELRVHQIELEMQNEELRRTQDEMEVSRARYFDLYDLAPVGYVTINEKGLILETNLAVADMLNVLRGDLLGMPFSGFIVKEYQDKYYLQRKQLFETEKQFLCELQMTRKDGAKFWAYMQAIKATEPGGEPVCWMVIRDITEQKNIEKEREKFMEQSKMATVGRVAGRMAHDFNNMLGVILGISKLLLSEQLVPDIKSDVEIIHESAMRGRGFTKNLLLFANDQEPKMIRFNLNDKISLIIRSMKSDLKGVEVVTDFCDEMENVLADIGLLENALINLIQNAIHAMSKTVEPSLIIKTYTDDINIGIAITDNGCGIANEWKYMIYEPTISFKGVGDKTGAYSSSISGSGYGMSNVKRFVEKHGGSIDFDSEVNKGTTFRIKLPIIKEVLSDTELTAVWNAKEIRGKNILLVEDEPHIGKILSLVLQQLDHNVTLAVNGEMALENIKKNSWNAISLDFTLPDMDGMKLYRKIREIDKDVPVIFVSGNFEFMQSMIDLKREDKKVDHIAKPFSNVEYVNAINKWL